MPKSLYMGPTRETMSGLRSGMQSRRIGQLMKGAQMGDPKAMEGLYMMDPQQAMAIKQQRDKQAAAAEQNKMAADVDKRKRMGELQDLMGTHQERMSTMSPEQQTEYYAREIGPLKELYPEVGAHLPDELTPEMLTELKPKVEYKDLQGLRKEFSKESGEFKKQSAAYDRLKRSAFGKDGKVKLDGASQMALLFNYLKVLDPGSTVRESEYKSAEDARALMTEIEIDSANRGVPIPAKVMSMIQKMQTGGKLLERDVRAIANAATDMYRGSIETQDKLNVFYSTEAKRMGIDPARITDLIKGTKIPEEALLPREKTLENYTPEELVNLPLERLKQLRAMSQ